MAEAMFDYVSQHVGDLALKAGDKVEVLRKGDDGWWSGTLRGQQGNFPGYFWHPNLCFARLFLHCDCSSLVLCAFGVRVLEVPGTFHSLISNLEN